MVEPEEWQHFEEYTHRVRELHYDADYELKVHPSVWTHLQEHYGHSPMLPQLKKLDVMAVSPYCVSPLLLLLHPALRSLAIAFGRDMIISPPTAAMPPGAAVLEVVSGSSPDVHVLDLRHSFLMTMPAIGALADLRQLKKLVLCQCSQCSVSSCSPIWTVPLADSLRVCALAVKDIPDTFAPGSFRSLRELSVNGLPGDVVNFIRGIQPIALHTFNLIARRASRQVALPPHLSSVCGSLPATVEHFKLTFEAGRQTDPLCGLSALLVHMRPLRNLTSLTLHGNATGVDLAGEDIRVLGELWPRLQSLSITRHPAPYPSRRSRLRETVTLQGLAEIARRCPALEVLSLPRLGAAELSFAESDIPVTSHGLRFIEFQDVCGAREPSAVASAIARLFPRLELDTSADEKSGCGGEWHGEWQVVRSLLREAVRRADSIPLYSTSIARRSSPVFNDSGS